MHLSPLQKRRLGKIIPFGLIWMVYGMIYSLVQKGLLGELTVYPSTGNPYDFTSQILLTSFGSLILGMILGLLEGIYLTNKFKTVSFGQKVFYKAAIYIVAICFFLIVLTFTFNSLSLNQPFYNEFVANTVWTFMSDFAFWSVIIYLSAVIVVTLFISEVSDNLGVGVLMNFVRGKYHSPREEKRIFMFLDMRSSTSIAEKLGHIRYYELLNDYYADMTTEILRNEGQIYQYVGDEIIVSWSLKKGLRKLHCLACFFSIRNKFQHVAAKYEYKYQVIPEFKAGMHYGVVTAGEIGVVKKEIVFTGDVLNTTSRIQGLCNEFGVELLISDQLQGKIGEGFPYTINEIGKYDLRGKEESMRLFRVELES